MSRGPRPGSLTIAAVSAVLLCLAACGGTVPAHHSRTRTKASPTSSPSPAPTAVTVIAPLGVNLRSGPSTSDSVIGVLSQGVSLPILSHTAQAGGWWEVKGSSASGWVTANSQYTSTMTFQTFSVPGSTPWSVMYPQGWTFAQKATDQVQFTGPPGSAITFTTAASVSQLPPAATAGESQSGVTAVVVYGVTAPLVTYVSATQYLASAEFQGQPALAFLIQASLPEKGGEKTLQLFLETVFFTVPATPSP
ncbi:MAG: SH3 domain-containing protein [Candidatus Dormibacteria bacterium]